MKSDCSNFDRESTRRVVVHRAEAYIRVPSLYLIRLYLNRERNDVAGHPRGCPQRWRLGELHGTRG